MTGGGDDRELIRRLFALLTARLEDAAAAAAEGQSRTISTGDAADLVAFIQAIARDVSLSRRQSGLL